LMDKKQKARAINAFKVGDKRIIIATKAMERGHNLQNAAVVINADVPFNPASLAQRIGRVRRLGSQHDTVRMINLIAAGTIEETLIRRKIYSKRKLFENIFGDTEMSLADPIKKLNGTALRKLL